MAIALYDVSVAAFQQVLAGVAGFLDKASKHCGEHDVDLHATPMPRPACGPTHGKPSTPWRAATWSSRVRAKV